MSVMPTYPATYRMIALEGAEIALTEYGDSTNPTVLLLHGIGGRGSSWANVIDPLADEFHVVALDLRGHGASSRPARGYRVEDYAADLEGVLEALGIERPLIVGHSLGGLITLEWARKHPARAAALVIEDSPLRTSQDPASLFDGWIALNSMPLEDAAAYYQREYPEWSAEDCRNRAEAITSVASGVFTELKAQDVEQAGRRLVPDLATIESPVLLVYGDLETGGMVVPEDAQEFERTLPNATIHRIPGGGHSLHREFAGAFLGVVLPFLRAHRP